MEPITITINQQEVSGYTGMTILEIAREAGIYIPTLCDDPNLEPVGACRMCLVENEETGALHASCVTAASSGMAINTNSPRVVEHRKNLIKLLLASHPEACLICDKGNNCRLRQIATELGIGMTELERIPRPAAIEEINPFVFRDTSKCIMCGKCIRADHEIVVEGAIDYYERGFIIKPATFLDYPLEKSECTFCGTCVALCPTGALMEQEKLYQGTGQRTVLTTCAYCGCGCSLSLEIKEDKVVRAFPEGNTPNRGALCVRGSYGFDYIQNSERLTAPLVKKNGEFKEVSWEEALQVASEGLLSAKEQHGPGALGVLGSSKCTNEENYLLQKFARTALGTNNIDNGSSFYNAAVREGFSDTLGFLSSANVLKELEQADTILVVGTDPTVTAPQVGYAIKRAVRFKDSKLVLVEPRRTKLSSFAHQCMRIKPESDLALLNGMAQAIIEENLINEGVSPQTEGLGELQEVLKDFTPESVQDITGISAEKIRSAARLYAGASKAVILFGSGITTAENGAENVKALANLALLTGNVTETSCDIYPIQKENNAQGACDMGSLPGFMPGYNPVTDSKARQKFEELWKTTIPSEKGLTMSEIVSQGEDIPLKALYIVGENVVSGFPPQSQLAAEALSSLDFLVVQDLFLTETARFADVVLPAASFAEKEGTFTNLEGRIGWLQEALPPKGQSLPDWQIILRLAREMETPLPYSSLQEVMDEISENVPFYQGYSYKQGHLEEKSFEEVAANRAFQSAEVYPRFSPGVQFSQQYRRPEGYPFYLILEPSLTHFGSGVRSGKSRRLRGFYPTTALKISKSDAEDMSLASGDKLRIRSPYSQVTAVVEISNEVSPGTVSIPTSFPGVLELFCITSRKEKRAAVPEACYVTLERVNVYG